MNQIYGGRFTDLLEGEIVESVPAMSAAGLVVVGNAQASRVGQELARWARQAEHVFGSRSNIYMLVDRFSDVSHAWVETTRVGDTALQYVTTAVVDVKSRRDIGYASTLSRQAGLVFSSTKVEAEPTTAALFDELADAWIDATQFESNMTATFTHEKYMQIIGLGPAAIPYLLARLPDEPWRWDGALRFITRLDITDSAQSPDEAVVAWQEWAATRPFS